MFILDERLADDSVEVCQLKLSCVGLIRDARYPWLVLVPMGDGLVEVSDLDADGQALLWREVGKCSECLQTLYPQAKINIGALGNVVRQLHVHVVARHQGDAAWPDPVWGAGEALAYGKTELATEVRRLALALGEPCP